MTFHVSAIKYTAMDVHFISGVVDRLFFFFLIICLATQDEVGALQITALDIP